MEFAIYQRNTQGKVMVRYPEHVTSVALGNVTRLNVCHSNSDIVAKVSSVR